MLTEQPLKVMDQHRLEWIFVSRPHGKLPERLIFAELKDCWQQLSNADEALNSNGQNLQIHFHIS
ncbi:MULTISPECIES: hypothetical protein [Sphingobium]|uniref:hypothetical protein n=1 Tax=Sphingobium TaxID=165695 RepID=UPI0004E3E66F|nr:MULTISPECIES: hypothetical protein [Sphingobium]KFD26728.1 hypothetical protein IH86_18475 [Sphingobium yanoikuyae]MDV3482047.1 hypothetical protein [Sphingobium yanoikuyae]HUD94285.1 hypothetical protein [Sphingobium sp.]